MNRISTPYNLQTYQTRLNNPNEQLNNHKTELKETLSSLIEEKIKTLNLNSDDDLTDAHYRDILDSLHNAKTSKFHRILHDAGIKTVSKYSWFSNQRATGKIEGLKRYLEVGNDLQEKTEMRSLFTMNNERTRLQPTQSRSKKYNFVKNYTFNNQMVSINEKKSLPIGTAQGINGKVPTFTGIMDANNLVKGYITWNDMFFREFVGTFKDNKVDTGYLKKGDTYGFYETGVYKESANKQKFDDAVLIYLNQKQSLDESLKTSEMNLTKE